ncbi:MAG: EBP domain protein [Benniella sp.]|nr:MAG: EBP domain protein [Benniella sp.]
MTSTPGRTPHPYYPRDLVLEHYVPNTNSVVKSLGHVLLAFSTVVCLALALGRPKRHTTLQHFEDRLTFFWFVLCGLLHILFEGYFGINHATLAGDLSPVAQVWKEYALSDSRYLSSDPFVLVVERITTLVWGPLAIYSAWSLYHDLPSRHIAQLILSLGQIYGCILYYWTSIVEGSPECHPDPYYYYFYFWFFNIFWMIAPVFLARRSIHILCEAIVQQEK